VDVADRRNRLVKTLPGGIRQRLALGGAIIHDPPVIFLDEPTSGVDPLMRRLFWEQIYRFSSEGKTIFVTTHYMDEAEHCHRMAFIISGRLIALDSPGALKEQVPYDVHSVAVSDFLRAFDLLAEQGFLREAALFGSDIHVLSDRESHAAARIRELLEKRGFRDIRVSRIRPSLEDVFVMHARGQG
jgi:ABC-2 type transport system ATP-binding protein